MSHPFNYIKIPPLSLSILSGALLVLIQPPVSLFFLAFLALVPLFCALDTENLRRSFISGCVAGVVCYLGLLYWVIVAVHKYGGINVYLSFLILMLLVFYVAIYMGAFSFAVAYCEKRFSIPFYLSAPPIWVLLEYLRGCLITGFPWSFLSHSQYNFLPFIQIISITGAYYISFIIVAINATLFALLHRKRISLIYVAVLVLLISSTLLYGMMNLRAKPVETSKAVIIQGNVTQDVKWDEAFKIKTIMAYCKGTLEAGKGADLIVWPETAMPFIFNQEPQASKYIKALPPVVNSYLLFGTISRDRDGKLHNSAYLLDPKGQEAGRYDKSHLVPFGEYTPLRAYLPFLERLSVQIGEFFPGDGHAPINTEMGKVGVLICYEGIFPYITREMTRKGAELLVNITNDAWYDRTSAPYQHLAFYVFRAIESDRFVLRAANTGISAIIDPQGKAQKKTPIFEYRVLTGGFSFKDTKTFYVRYGEWFVSFSLLFLAAIIVVRLMAARKQPD